MPPDRPVTHLTTPTIVPLCSGKFLTMTHMPATVDKQADIPVRRVAPVACAAVDLSGQAGYLWEYRDQSLRGRPHQQITTSKAYPRKKHAV
jgi:hypothetical protein